MEKHTNSETFRPNYYMLPNGIECKDVVSHFPYNIGVAMAYAWRAGKKVEEGLTPKQAKIKDLRKAIEHLQFEIEKTEKEPDDDK